MAEAPATSVEGTGTITTSHRRPRARYIAQACNLCRRSKLKCDGKQPCRRCVLHSTHCEYSATPRRPRTTTDDVQTAYAETLPVSTEDRLAAVEARLALLDSPRISQPRSRLALDADNPYVERWQFPRPLTESRSTIQFASRTLPFVSSVEHDDYLHFFFHDINPCHSCVNEADFQTKVAHLRSGPAVTKDNLSFLALNYIIFACADVLQNIELNQSEATTPGWSWYLAADGIIGKLKVSGSVDVSLIQFLIYESFYLMHADKPNAAYTTIGLACRRCFQMGYHQQGPTEDFVEHMKQRIFWTTYYVDRRISLSCGRPYGIRDTDISVSLPEFLDDSQLSPGTPLPAPNPTASSIPYLCSTIAFAKFAGEIWDQVFAARTTQDQAEIIVMLDAKIKHWVDTSLPNLSLAISGDTNSLRHRRQYCLVVTRFSHLRLLLRRRKMVSMQFTEQEGLLCGELACSIIDHIGRHRDEISKPSSFRFHMAVSLAGAVLVLVTLIISPIDRFLEQPMYAIAFDDGLAMLKALSEHLQSAHRLVQDLSPVTHVVQSKLAQSPPTAGELGLLNEFDALLPYGEIDFAQQDVAWGEQLLPPDVEGQPVATNQSCNIPAEPWADLFDSSITGYGAPWI